MVHSSKALPLQALSFLVIGLGALGHPLNDAASSETSCTSEPKPTPIWVTRHHEAPDGLSVIPLPSHHHHVPAEAREESIVCPSVLLTPFSFNLGPTTTTWTTTISTAVAVDCGGCTEPRPKILQQGHGPVVTFDKTVTALVPKIVTDWICSPTTTPTSTTITLGERHTIDFPTNFPFPPPPPHPKGSSMVTLRPVPSSEEAVPTDEVITTTTDEVLTRTKHPVFPSRPPFPFTSKKKTRWPLPTTKDVVLPTKTKDSILPTSTRSTIRE